MVFSAPSYEGETRTLPAMRVVIYDDGAPDLAALTDLRSVYDVRTGCRTSRERIEAELGARADALFVPAALEDLARDSTGVTINPPDTPADALVVNGRCVLPPADITDLAPGEALLEAHSGDLIAARVDRAAGRALMASFTPPARAMTRTSDEPCLLHRPWDVIHFRDAAIERDLPAIITRDGRHARAADSGALPGVTTMGAHPIRIDPSATIAPTVVLDATRGPIVIDDGAIVRPGAILIGPAFVGPHSTILDHALIKANTAIGPHCKIAGEVGGTIIQGYSNKAHDGHLGDAWLGEWVNLGAGTVNSNLLNTYGEVAAAATPRSSRERTGLTFFGGVLGDYVKTAIGTRLMTGSIIGTGAMLASTAPPPTAVERFAWITDAGATRYTLDRFLDAAERMMSRRDLTLTGALRARLAALHGATA